MWGSEDLKQLFAMGIIAERGEGMQSSSHLYNIYIYH